VAMKAEREEIGLLLPADDLTQHPVTPVSAFADGLAKMNAHVPTQPCEAKTLNSNRRIKMHGLALCAQNSAEF
jgi:hypothetical protein